MILSRLCKTYPNDSIRALLTIISPFFRKSLQILGSSECHPGASCRTAFALSEVYERIGDSKMAARYMKEGKIHRSRIVGAEFFELGISPGEYDRFVGFSHR